METEKYIAISKKAVADYCLEKGLKFTKIRTVWFNRTLENMKGLFCTDGKDNLYFEVTYNGKKDEFYVDAYNQVEHREYRNSENKKEEKFDAKTGKFKETHIDEKELEKELDEFLTDRKAINKLLRAIFED